VLSFLHYVFKMGVEVKNLGVLNSILPMIQQAGERAVKRIADHAKNGAIVHYKKYRGTLSKNKKLLPTSSLIIDSFTVSQPTTTGFEFRAVVFAGGPVAPYAVFVDQPRQSFKGYFFMKAGAIAAEEIAPTVLNDEFKNIGKISITNTQNTAR